MSEHAAIALASLGLDSLLTLNRVGAIPGDGRAHGAGRGAFSRCAPCLRRYRPAFAGGIAIGLTLMAATARVLQAALFGVGPLDLATLGVTVFALAAVTLAASIVPAWRAASIDPIASVRAD